MENPRVVEQFILFGHTVFQREFEKTGRSARRTRVAKDGNPHVYTYKVTGNAIPKIIQEKQEYYYKQEEIQFRRLTDASPNLYINGNRVIGRRLHLIR